MTPHPTIGLGSFACTFGALERKAQDIPDFERLWQEQSSDADFATMGCGTFRAFAGPVEDHVVETVRATLRDASVRPADVDRVVFATSDARLASLRPDFAAEVLGALGLVHCVPVVLSFQQCCSSLAALRHARDLLADEEVRNVVLVSLDYTPDDADRVRSFALFGDAVASCLLTRGDGLVRLLSSAVGVDHAGLRGQDSFLSRQQVAQTALAAALGAHDLVPGDVTKVFPTNLYRPVALFNATIAGIGREQLHFSGPLEHYGHCGNSDWMINLADYHDQVGIRPDETYLALSSAPGFFACGLLAGA
ncbi:MULTISPECIES: hypothetical protein [Streptomyces]|uniref:Beta-ketoacyl-[acyl-carrier-protein] synthase III N-terminal domain-containing protein n=1 Tax=Streptomyces drozdowiczii TaxID=202862 RepID=A0ABY6Q008_9ACTN|nr:MULTISPECIES: hypothetical protein [Streptomyces]MCX0242549.1 hypothetical protein [Streptomyces drozdowiczii]OKJ70014.1 hypothetical protein AMK30_27885 [Streptomyces sp. CB02460]UZK57411.1 hypothetical protein NEH16_27975 [Streptomyces drozdowiczii]